MVRTKPTVWWGAETKLWSRPWLSKQHYLRGTPSSTRRKLLQLAFSPLISQPRRGKAIFHLRSMIPSLGWKQEKQPPVLHPHVHKVWMEAGSGWWGKCMSVWATLTEQLTSVGVCRCQSHVPTVHRAAIPLRRGRHWWEPKDLLKASSYCKLAPRSLQSKKSLWFCIWHIYAPFLLGTRLSASEQDLNFQKEKCPETQIHQGIKETGERLHATPQCRQQT